MSDPARQGAFDMAKIPDVVGAILVTNEDTMSVILRLSVSRRGSSSVTGIFW
jgi:hypothetical protein